MKPNKPHRIGTGRTQPGKTKWLPYPDHRTGKPTTRGVYADVDTTSAGFAKTPNYVASLGGKTNHWELSGTSAIYKATKAGFRIYLRWSNGTEKPPLTPKLANAYKWHVLWIGIG